MLDYTGTITLTDSTYNGKYFCLYTKELTGGIENYMVSDYSLKIDDIAPTIPSITAPVNNQNVYFLNVNLVWAYDNESGLSGYHYEIAQNATFLDVISSWTIYTTGNIITPIFNEADATYSIRVRAVDAIWNQSARSNIVDFNHKNLSNFSFTNVENAQTGTEYISNEIQMWWLATNEIIRASITTGTLMRNWVQKGLGTWVQNNDMLAIKMTSSPNYSGVVQSQLKIASKLIDWKITNIQSGGISTTGFNLTPAEMLAVQAIFNSILNMYTNPSQLQAFLLVMKSMLEDNIALAWNNNVDNLKYLLYLINNHLSGGFGNNNPNLHIAPNCKEYLIVLETGSNTYYSPNTMKQTRFGSRDELEKYLDSHNPGDCHINTYWNTVSYDNTNPNRHIAPNGKVYNIQLQNLWYTSNDFIKARYFASLSELRAFIDQNNPAIIVRNHTVDTNFTPIIHTAPNWKSYKIYNTNKWYMSYKLIKVQYFGGLEQLKNYIDVNNKQ